MLTAHKYCSEHERIVIILDKKLQIFYFSSTHWDREWYQHFQGFRFRLVRMIDNLLDLFHNDNNYETFHFDGQTIVLEDYTEIKSQNSQKLKKLISDGKILIGPWYVMPDEFLLSGESLIRNLMIGHKIANEYGVKPWKYGYICDIFGHIAQMPQIFNGFDIKYSILGRGTNESDPAYFRWQAPDGSECLSFKLHESGGYGDFNAQVYGNENDKTTANPLIETRIKEYIDREIARCDYPIIIVMDGMDHSEAAVNTSDYIKIIKKLYPDADVHHINLEHQGQMLSEYRDTMPVIAGELNKTATGRYEYLHLITNTLSSYYTLKQMNDRCQNLLEKKIEPISVFARLENKAFEQEYLHYAYKTLIKNHPHDSICGCAIDSVHKDMEYRFEQVTALCETLEKDYYFSDNNKFSEKGIYNVLRLYNTLPYSRTETVSVELDFRADYPTYEEPFGYEKINSFKIYDHEGNEIPYGIKSIKRNYLRHLCEDKTHNVDVHEVVFDATLPPFGKAEYKIVPCETSVRYLKKMTCGENYAENSLIRLTILSDGSLELLDKKTGRVYTGLGSFVDDGEIGDGWYHTNPIEDSTHTTKGGSCKISRSFLSPSMCEFKITRELEVPESIVQDTHSIKRSEKTVVLKFTTTVQITENSDIVKIKTSFENTARDHRLRMVIPTGITTDTYFSGQAFYCCDRKIGINYETQDWLETDQYEKSTNGIFGKRNTDGSGLAFISAEGLHECAAYDDANGTLMVTLLRAFEKTVMTNGENRCQLLIPLEYEYAFVPLNNEKTYCDLIHIQDTMASKLTGVCRETSEDYSVASPISYLSLSGDGIAASAIRCAEDETGIIIRLFNASHKTTEACLNISFNTKNAYLTNLNEEIIDEICIENGIIKFNVDSWKIVTVKIPFNNK